MINLYMERTITSCGEKFKLCLDRNFQNNMVDLLHVVPFLSSFALFDPDDGLFEAAPDMIEILTSLEVMSCRTGLTSQ